MSPLTGVASMTIMDIDETEGKGWEISFDTDTEDEEEAGLDFGMDIPCRDSKDSHSPDGAEYKLVTYSYPVSCSIICYTLTYSPVIPRLC